MYFLVRSNRGGVFPEGNPNLIIINFYPHWPAQNGYCTDRSPLFVHSGEKIKVAKSNLPLIPF
jgi:hypothetical protein